jgi:hypothetical protein
LLLRELRVDHVLKDGPRPMRRGTTIDAGAQSKVACQRISWRKKQRPST